jgi:hypothetical protein
MRQRTIGPRLALFAVAASACFAVGCEEDAPGSVATEPVTIRFAAVVGDLPWRCGQLYQQLGVTPAAVQPQDLRFFAHGFELVRGDGSVEPVVLDDVTGWQANQVALLDFEDGAGKCNTGTPATRGEVSGSVAQGD